MGQDGEHSTGERIAKRLARAGVASRREAERMIAAGRVKVNGARIDSPALNVGPDDKVEVDGVAIAAAEPPRLWRYHKPAGLVTTERDEKGRETVFDKLPADLPRVMSVGRLDLNSEGLLLLTNDGELKRRLELPSTGWTRRYRARAHGRIEDEGLEPLRRGVTVEGDRFQPMTVTIERRQGSNVWIAVALKEGRNREVRRALEAVGLVVNRLIRVSYGPFQLGDLAPGGVEEVKSRILRDQLGLKREAEAQKPARGPAPRPGRKPKPDDDPKGGPKGGPTGGKPGVRSASRAGNPRGTPRGSRRG